MRKESQESLDGNARLDEMVELLLTDFRSFSEKYQSQIKYESISNTIYRNSANQEK